MMFLQSRKKSAILKKTQHFNFDTDAARADPCDQRTKAFTTVTLELFPTEPVTCGLICAVFFTKQLKNKNFWGKPFVPFCFLLFLL